jgi:hypothetical protein
MKTVDGTAQSVNAKLLGTTYLATCPHTNGVIHMSTSHPISRMSPPAHGEKVPGVTFSYFNARNRRRSFDFLTKKFKESGITRTELAIRTGKSRALISRLLGQPGNLTADTMAELLFAMSGEEIQYSTSRPSIGHIKSGQSLQQTAVKANAIWLPAEEHRGWVIAPVRPMIIGPSNGTVVPGATQKIDVLQAAA